LKTMAAAVRESAARRVGTAVAEKMGKEVAENAAKQGSRALAPWTFRAGQQAARQMLASVQRALIVDMTPVVRGLYKRSGLNGKTFRIIDGLEPKIFMRKDRRVVVDLVGDHPLGRFLSETATNAGVDKGLGNEVVVEGAQAAFIEGSAAVEAARRNISAWWLAAGDGTLDRLAQTASPALAK